MLAIYESECEVEANLCGDSEDMVHHRSRRMLKEEEFFLCSRFKGIHETCSTQNRFNRAVSPKAAGWAETNTVIERQRQCWRAAYIYSRVA